jgi:hypothetical protein
LAALAFFAFFFAVVAAAGLHNWAADNQAAEHRRWQASPTHATAVDQSVLVGASAR